MAEKRTINLLALKAEQRAAEKALMRELGIEEPAAPAPQPQDAAR